MGVTTQMELCLHEQTQIIANTACRVGNQLDIASYLFLFFYYLFQIRCFTQVISIHQVTPLPIFYTCDIPFQLHACEKIPCLPMYTILCTILPVRVC